MTQWPLAPVPGWLPLVGNVLAAIPVHTPVDATDPTEWIALCDRGPAEPELAGDERRYSTNRVQRRGDELFASGGEYDLTYDKALISLFERAGTIAPARLKRAVEKADFWIANLTANAEHQRDTDAPSATVQATMTRATDLADVRNILTGDDW